MNPLLLQLYARFGLEPTEANREALRAVIAKDKTAIRAGMLAPRTVDADSRSIDAVIATEDPVEVWDYERWEPVDEILLMRGARLAKVRKGKLPLLDAHQRDTTRRVLGSVVDLRVDGTELVGTEVYSALSEPEFVKATEGHLDQRSVGYRIYAATYIKPGESATVEGKPFTARPNRGLSVVTDWIPLESSVVAIGADPASGTRAVATPSVTKPVPQHQENRTVMKITVEMRARLVSLGMPETATDEEATAFLFKPETQRALLPPVQPQAPAASPSGTAPDPARAAADKRLADLEARFQARENQAQVETVFRSYLHVDGVDALRTKALQDGITVDLARSILLDHLHKQTPSTGRAVITKDQADHRRANAVAAIFQRANPTATVTDAERQQAAAFGRFSLFDLARQCLEDRGIATRGMDKMELVGRAFTATDDFPHILSNTANKQLMAAYAAAPLPWAKWCKRGSLSDFKATPRVGMSESGTLPSVPEGAEFPQYSIADTQENIQLGTYGKIFAITRQAIINDDLDAFSTLPTRHARAWARTINQTAVAVLLANAAMHDAVALYYARTSGGASNLDTSTTAVTTQATAEAVVRALRKLIAAQKDADGTSYLQLRPRWVLTCPTLYRFYELALYELNRASGNRSVDIERMGLDVMEEPEIENSALTGYGVNLTYMFCDPADAPAVEVAFLDGNAAPTLETEQGFSIDGVKYKVRGDVAAKAIDFRPTAKHVL